MSKKKKIRRFRGSRTCGEGKDHRGHGDRGGRGLAGSGKRASHKLSYFQNYGITLGKRGFASYKRRKIVKTINLASIERNLNKLLKENKVELKENFYIVDLAKLGYDKLLGSGKVTKKYKIITPLISKGAKEKVEEMKGVVEQI